MLQLKEITKIYRTGELVQTALKEATLTLRSSEFVSILGPSGSGKTTLLNIIGGLDRYDEGDLIINGTSTKQYTDRDWDTYRNHTVGFVFQSYNLIPHQSILANVELALTIGGISRGERCRRATQALEEVGLGQHLHKKPNQLSGGQMQRVAIARALVNNPSILLADEPTGALDSATSIQVMELLKKVAEKRLVVMVTHNPDLAKRYSSRIVLLRDGEVIGDSNPFQPGEEDMVVRRRAKRGTPQAKMSFATSLSLSFNNLRTKKGRTLLTSFAGSIGIIGIALILALSGGVNTYISNIQKDTMSSYPITIGTETVDMSAALGLDGLGDTLAEDETEQTETDKVTMDLSSLKERQQMSSHISRNNLTAFKKYLDDPDSEIAPYIGENGVVYGYDVNFSVFARDENDKLIDTNTDPSDLLDASSTLSNLLGSGSSVSLTGSVAGSSSGAANFSELMRGADNTGVSRVVTDSYELVYGKWPEKYNEVMLVLDEKGCLSADVLYQLGIITADDYKELAAKTDAGEDVELRQFGYEELCGQKLQLVAACDRYVKEDEDDDTFTYLDDPALDEKELMKNAVELSFVGVIRPVEDAANADISTPVVYGSALTDYLIEHADESAVIRAQEENPEVNILNDMNFVAADDAAKADDARTYLESLGVSDQATMYQMVLLYTAEKEEEENADKENPDTADDAGNEEDEIAGISESMLASMLEYWLDDDPDEEILCRIYDDYIGTASLEDNLKKFGKVSYDSPDSISIYIDSFEDKEAIATCIDHYNENSDSDNHITYVDYVALLTSSITSIVDVISYVLIAFVAVSLVVSCIMIGIITHISVLERTKEIGILRAIGASKRNISQVFNAETVIIGLCSGVLGVAVSWLLTIPINAIIRQLLDESEITAKLPLPYALLLVAISVTITVLGGLVPAKKAAEKDPVIALRSE